MTVQSAVEFARIAPATTADSRVREPSKAVHNKFIIIKQNNRILHFYFYCLKAKFQFYSTSVQRTSITIFCILLNTREHFAALLQYKNTLLSSCLDQAESSSLHSFKWKQIGNLTTNYRR